MVGRARKREGEGGQERGRGREDVLFHEPLGFRAAVMILFVLTVTLSRADFVLTNLPFYTVIVQHFFTRAVLLDFSFDSQQ